MSTSMRDLISGEAELDDEEDDESFDDETGEERNKERAGIDDSSEEEEDDDDEEEARKIREGFIVDEDDEEDQGEGSDVEGRPHGKRKRKHHEHRDKQEEEALDEDDLDLIGEQFGSRPKPQTQSKYKRLKRGHRDEEEEDTGRRGLDDIFADDDEEEQRTLNRSNFRAQADEFDDFIEEDFPEDEDERIRQLEDAEVARPKERGAGAIVDTSGLDKDALDDMEAIFGNGEDYDWALALEYEQDERERDEGAIELKDVFEPSQLKEKMLTDEDNQIRFTDEPERFQLDRKLFKNLQLTAEQFREEARWITNLLWPRKEKELSQSLQGPFSRAIGKVLEFFIVDEVEVPYVFQHRKDYLLYTKDSRSKDLDEPDMPTVAEKLLNQDDLWKILELDIKFRSFVEKRNALEKSYESLKSGFEVEDQMIEDMIAEAATMEELQDLQDYLHFQYASQMKQLAAANGASQTKRPGSKSTVLDRVREGRAYQFVSAYGISADQLAKNALRAGKRVAPDDDAKYPMDLADDLTDDYFTTGDAVMNAARQLYAEELFNSPRMRKHFRKSYELNAEISVRRTDKGLRHIHESHPYYDVKYIQNQTVPDLALEPELFLKMIKAEEDKLVDIKVEMPRRYDFRRQLYQEFESENFSDRAEQWRNERKKVLDLAYPKLERIIAKSLKETIRSYCQDVLLSKVRDEYSRRLDQAPYKPKGMVLGTSPKVLALSNGLGDPARDPVFWAWVEHDGRVLEQGKFGNLARDEAQREEFAALVNHRHPDVIAVSGWSTFSQKLVRDIEDLVRDKDLRGLEYEDDINDWRTAPLEVVVVNDEVARLYKDSERARTEHPTLNPVTRYCIALARYMQSPLKEYAALGKDVSSLAFHSSQKLLPEDKVEKYLETAMVDMVNLCGVNINDAMTDTYIANLLPFVSGLGPRKATSVVKAINANGGTVQSRDELVGDPDSGKFPVVGPRVWNNCASFLYIDYDNTSSESDPLDNTRVHPEDYELGRKMAADALELDEEDVKAEMDENGAGAIVRRLFKNEEQDKVNELVLEEYAEQLESKYQQRKRATLETIRAELQAPYEELRRNFGLLTIPEIFTMFTGETSKSLCEGMIVAVNVRVVKDDFAIAKLDCGIEGRLEAHEVTTGPSVKDVLSSGQTTQAKILELNYKDFIAKLSMREDVMRIPYKRPINYGRDGWDYAQEAADKEELREKDKSTGRTQRVVKHPNFRPYNSVQAEEYLGSKPIGEVVIRPSSKGNDHLAVTWKVADNVYQHLDVLEMQKENEFAVGKVLRVGKYTYSDLDELIVLHVKATARKVEELMRHDKFQNKSRNDTEKWLTTYINANPNLSAYAFCVDTKHAGYFWLCFKANKEAGVIAVPVRSIPQGYTLKGYDYPDTRALCNGFKLRFRNEFATMGAPRSKQAFNPPSSPKMTRSHKANDRDHKGIAEGTAVPVEHLPRFFAKNGYADVDPKKIKKDGGGKGNWGTIGDVVTDEGFTVTNARRRSNSSLSSPYLSDFKTKFEVNEPEPVFEESIHGAGVDENGEELSKTDSSESGRSDMA